MTGRPLKTWDAFEAAFSSSDREALPLNVQREGQGRSVVMLHGLGASLYSWHHLAAARPHAFETILIDLKGHGDSPKPIDHRYGIYDHALHVIAMIERLGVSEVTLVGNSLGGGCALVTALALAKLGNVSVDKLVLIGSIGVPQPVPFIFHGVHIPVLPELLRGLLPATWVARTALSYCYSDPTRITAAQVEAYARPAHSQAQRLAVIRSARYVEPDDLDRLVTRYRDIHCPTLLLWGEDDRVVPLIVGKRLHELLPNAYFECLPDCGHIPQEEQPSTCAALVWGFIEKGEIST